MRKPLVGLVILFLAPALASGQTVNAPDRLRAARQAKAVPNPDSVKQRVDELGVGARVKVKLAGGKKLRGSIEAIDEEGFLLSSQRKAARRHIAYTQVARLKLAKRSYRAAGQPDPLEARRVVAALGVGEHVMVKVPGGKKLRGRIQAIEAEHFTLRLDREGTTTQIAYNQVWRVQENLSKGAKIAIIVVAAVVVTLLTIRLVYGPS